MNKPMAPVTATQSAEQIGPHPSYIQVAKPFVFEQKVQSQIIGTGANPQREDSFRLLGVQWIDDARRALGLPVRTFNTAVIYYHKFRLVHKDNEYQFADAAAAALFSACKIEDTLKKSREILCAAHNGKVSSSEQLTPDDGVFDGPSKVIIGLERLMLEASGFDYRNRHPQKYLLKLARKSELDKDVIRNAYKMMLDLYRTFAPLKLTSSAMAMACLELTTRLMDKQLENVRGEKAPNRERCEVHRQQIMEAMLDLLDLYTHFQKSSTIGPTYNMDSFIKVRITLNQEAEERKLPRFAEWRDTKTNGFKSSIKTPKTPITPKSPTEVRVNGRDVVSPATLSPRSSGSGRKGIGARGQDGTVRFMLDGAQAKAEKAAVSEYYKTEYEDVEIEVDEPAPPEREEPYMRNGPRADSRSEGTRNENRNGRHNRDDRRDHHGSRHFKRQRHR